MENWSQGYLDFLIQRLAARSLVHWAVNIRVCLGGGNGALNLPLRKAIESGVCKKRNGRR